MDRDSSNHELQILGSRLEESERNEFNEVSRLGKLKRRIKKRFEFEEIPKDGRVRIAPREKNVYSFLSGFNLLSEGAIDRYTHYLYRSSFLVAVLWFLLLYFCFITIYACIISGIIIAYGNRGRKCSSGWDYSASFAQNYEIGMGLSWTTLSTVGFGTISPPDESGCAGLRWFLAFEAFFGILFAGFCGAIFYSKVSRLCSRANITFSSPVCLSFGAGIPEATCVMVAAGDSSDTKTSVNQSENDGGVLPYPVLDFRCVNDRLDCPGNEILGAKIGCIAVSMQASQILRDCVQNHTKFKTKTALHEPIKKSYQQMQVSPECHPFFENVLYFRHELNGHSPLLKPSIRDRISQLGGWPSDLNNHASIRSCFSSSVVEFVVSVCGKSNLTADQVFRLHRYTFEDIYIGWRFVSMVKLSYALRKGKLGKLEKRRLFDPSYVHDIAPQVGGGEEPINDRDCGVEENYLRFLTVNGDEE